MNAGPVASQENVGICRNGPAGVFSGLNRIYVRDEFRIIYTTQGRHALANIRDRNRNGIPDQVEDVATQMIAARRVYSEVIGLKHPLSMPRYARVKSVDVFLLTMKGENGSAYDEAINYRLGFDGSEGRCILRIDLGNSLPTVNVTPAHELFHLYQYAYTMFKARWFLEGGARWAEYALKPGAGPQSPLPTTREAVKDRVFSQGYGASRLWNRLAAITDRRGRIRLSQELAGMTYVDGSTVVSDDILHGPAFIKAVFEELEGLSASVSFRNDWNRYGWEESEQKSPEHDEEIFRKIIKVFRDSVDRDGYKSEGVTDLIKIGL